ncbi:cystathionine beta-lyase / repressor domain protein, partial [Clostridioides difficile DA00273]
MINFDKKVDRLGTYCTQWDYVEDRFGKKDLLPFTISDMDLEFPFEITEVLQERLN